MSLKRFVNALIDRLNLERMDSCGFVGFHVLSIGDMPNKILSYYDKNGNEFTFSGQWIENIMWIYVYIMHPEPTHCIRSKILSLK